MRSRNLHVTCDLSHVDTFGGQLENLSTPPSVSDVVMYEHSLWPDIITSWDPIAEWSLTVSKICNNQQKLKAYRPHPHNDAHTSIDSHAKYQGQRSNDSAMWVLSDGRYQIYYLRESYAVNNAMQIHFRKFNREVSSFLHFPPTSYSSSPSGQSMKKLLAW